MGGDIGRQNNSGKGKSVSAEYPLTTTDADSATMPDAPRPIPDLNGRAEAGGSLSSFIWFRTGGAAEWLIRPDSTEDLAAFLHDLDADIPVMPIGVGSNIIIRDGGVPGVVVRLPKAMGKITIEDGHKVRAGGAAMGITLASAARDAGIAGLEFQRGIPGTIGGAVRMNAGAYGDETKDVLIEATLVLRDGTIETWDNDRFQYSYRHSAVPKGAIVTEALFQGVAGDPAEIGAKMDKIAAEREASQPLRSRTGGSTFKNPDGDKAWRLVDEAGCRGLKIGDAQVSEKHTNFLLNWAMPPLRILRHWVKKCASASRKNRAWSYNGKFSAWE